MKKFVYLMALLLATALGGCKESKTLKHENVTAIHKTRKQHKQEKVPSKRFVDSKEPVDVRIIKDTTFMGGYAPADEYVFGEKYLGCRIVKEKDTVRVGYLFSTFPPKVMDAIYEKGDRIIPFLIDCIDIEDETGSCGFHNPAYSDLPPVVMEPVGINYAYMIELILSKNAIEHVTGVPAMGDGWDEVMKPYRLYQHCIIVKKDIYDKPIIEKLSMDDMRKIKKIYSDWWVRHKDSGLQEMRYQWTAKHLFEDTPYMWL